MYEPSPTEQQAQFRLLTGAFPQTLVQIYKTMVRHSFVYNQYNLRDIMRPYVDVDYHRPGANSLTMQQKEHAKKVLATRAAQLSPDQLLPRSKVTPEGVTYSAILIAFWVGWGRRDNMMPEIQRHDFFNTLVNAHTVTEVSFENAGHFAGTDQPDYVAEAITQWLASGAVKGINKFDMADIYLGYDRNAILQGSEKEKMTVLRDLFFGNNPGTHNPGY